MSRFSALAHPVRFLRRAVPPLLAAAMPIIPSACGSGGDVAAPPAITGVLLSSTSVPLQGVGATASLVATIQPSTATGSISWRSDNASIATVSGNGGSATITATGGGTTIITATAGGFSASATVVVTPLVRSLTLSRTSVALLVGGSSPVTAAVAADAGASTRVIWTSSAPAVASVDSTGLIVGVAPGSATVTATSAVNSAVSGTISVAVAYAVVRSVTVTPANPSLLIAGTRQLSAALDVDAGTATTVSWTSATPAVATVSSTGLVTAVSAGTAIVRATSIANPTVSGTTTVSVSAPTVRAIALAPATASIIVGSTQQLVPTVDADAGANTQLSWTSTDASVATVNASGIVSAVAPGAVTIRATSVLVPTVTATATVNVSGPPVINAWSRQTLSPLSAGNSGDIRDLYTTSASDAFAVYSTDATDGTMLRFDGTGWNASVLSPFGSISAVGGAAGRVFAGNDYGQIAQFQTFVAANPTFVAMSAPAVGSIMRIIGVSGGNAVALAANSGFFAPGRAVLIYNGSAWTRLTDPPGMSAISSIDASALNNIVVGGGTGGATLMQWNGTSWTALPASPLSGSVSSIALLGPDVVIATSNFTTARLSGGVWTTHTMPAIRPNAGGAFVTRLVACGGQLYAGTTFDGRLLRLDGTTWSVIGDYGVPTRGSYAVTPSCGADGTLRAFGNDLSIGRWTGASWSLESSSPELMDVSLVSPTLAYATGGHGQVLRFDGTTWTRDFTTSAFGVLQTISATADGLVLTAGAGTPGGVFRKQGGVWSFDALASSPLAVWASSASFGLGISGSHTFVWNGNAWQTSAAIAGFNAVRIDGVSPTFAMASGSVSGGGAIYRWDGSTWSRMTTPATTATFNGLRVLSPTLAFAAAGLEVYKWDGSVWSKLPSVAGLIGSNPIRSLSALSANDVYALTGSGRLVRFNGTSWNLQELLPAAPPATQPYPSMALSNSLGIVVGYGGAIYLGRPGAMLRSAR